MGRQSDERGQTVSLLPVRQALRWRLILLCYWILINKGINSNVPVWLVLKPYQSNDKNRPGPAALEE